MNVTPSVCTIPFAFKRPEFDLAHQLDSEFGCHLDKLNTGCRCWDIGYRLGSFHELHRLGFERERPGPIWLDRAKEGAHGEGNSMQCFKC